MACLQAKTVLPSLEINENDSVTAGCFKNILPLNFAFDSKLKLYSISNSLYLKIFCGLKSYQVKIYSTKRRVSYF